MAIWPFLPVRFASSHFRAEARGGQAQAASRVVRVWVFIFVVSLFGIFMCLPCGFINYTKQASVVYLLIRSLSVRRGISATAFWCAAGERSRSDARVRRWRVSVEFSVCRAVMQLGGSGHVCGVVPRPRSVVARCCGGAAVRHHLRVRAAAAHTTTTTTTAKHSRPNEVSALRRATDPPGADC